MIKNIEKQDLSINEEQFCQAFEIKAMADLLIRQETERWVPGFAKPNVEIEHHNRYIWVSNFVYNQRVLDIACGVGKGSYLLVALGKASEVTGCDLEEESIQYARLRNKHPKITFTVGDAQNYFSENKFDIIVSFETIEHLENPEIFLKNMSKLLLPKGQFFISTPISKKKYDPNPENPYHRQEWGFEEFQKLTLKYFKIEKIYLQMREENYNSLFFKIKKYILSKIFNKSLNKFKNIFIDSDKAMLPILYQNKVEGIFKSFYGITGFQILVLSNKNE